MTASEEAARLREAAEARLRAQPPDTPESPGDTDLRRLVHELQVREIELELQNTELLRSRAEREEMLARYAELYDFAPVGYLTLSTDNLIAEINLTGATLLGVPRGKLMQRHFISFVAREDRERCTRFLADVEAHDGQESLDLELHRGNGTRFHAQLDCVRHKVGAGDTAPLSSGGLPGVSIAFTDVGVRKGVEAKLKQAIVAAEKANRAKTDFLSSMSHELRTPLNAILGYAQLMESSTPPPTAGQQHDLDRILKAGWYLLELINEILDLAMIESGRVQVSDEPVPMGDVMLECRAMIEPQAEKRGIAMTFPQCEIGCCVKADRVRVKQVLVNLLFNAVKYNRPGGRVEVECSGSTEDVIRISVRDTGVGLSAEQIEHLFQPFNRLGRESGAEEGTGIGLVVSKRLVELMGGDIGVTSIPGVGSVFWIELKRANGDTPPAPEAAFVAGEPTILLAPPTPTPTPALAQRTVLHVEDNPANLDLVDQLISRRTDLRLISATDGRLGIEFARAYLPQVILTDISLPDISGVEVMKALRAEPSTAHIPIIALSANAIQRDIDIGLEAGFFRYVTKPIRIQEFMDALDAALASAQAPGSDA